MQPRSPTLLTLAALAAAIALSAALALPPLPATAAQTSAAATDSGKPAGANSASGMMARVEKRIATLHAQLKITPAQEAQWQQFADVMRDNAQKMAQDAAARAQKYQSLNAVDNLKSYAEIAVEHGQNVQRLAAAFERLYNSLSPEQQKLADGVFRGRVAQRMQHQR